MTERIANVELVKIIKIQKLVGDGTNSNPYKTSFEYWTVDGEKIN